jgi:hypothetical protein
MIVTPTNVDFGTDENKALEVYVKEHIQALKDGLRDLHESRLPKWRRLYRGRPKEEVKNFPWKNASNIIIQLIGENCDIIRARILGTIFEIMPLWNTQLVGDWTQEAHGGEQQEAVQEFMNYVGLEPNELDLYRVESQGVDECVKFGTVMYALPWVQDVECDIVGEVEGKTAFRDFTKYEGPRPEKIEFEKWAATPSASTIESADFKYRIITLTKQKLMERFHKGIYKLKGKESQSKEDAETAFLASPDRPGPTHTQREREEATGAKTADGYGNAEWDIYECWFPYWHNGHKHKLIYSYHLASNTVMRAIFNFYPKNEEPWEMSRFGYTDDGLYGYGLCEMLEYYQADVATAYNQKNDNRTLANTSIFRIDPNSKLDAIFSIYPNALIPASEGELEKIQLGANYPSNMDEIGMTLSLAKSRAGTDDPGFSGAGGGTQNAKKGIYSAMGTFSVMQAGNRRVNLNITDCRYTHHKLGRKFLNQYAEFGVGERLQAFGERAKFLKMALDNVKAGKLILPIRSATASINKELEKQNDMLLTQVMQRHHMGVSQILQSVGNPGLPPELKDFLIGWIDSSSLLMARILRNFGHDDISRMLPERKIIEKQGASSGQQGGAGPTGGGAGGASQEAEGGAAVVPFNSPTGGKATGVSVPAGSRDPTAVPV